MPEKTITTFISNTLDTAADEGKPTMVKVDDVSMMFNIASETLSSLKEYAIAIARHELKFKPFFALNDINLELKKGDVFGILGTNGSGKSTLLKIIAGVLEPTKGTCTINGTIAPLIELGAGFDLELTARENVYLNGALLGYSKKFIDEHFDEIVSFAEVSNFLDMPLKNYSSGMVARIAFAIATAVIPDILIVDEVLSVGDFMFQQKCERRISSLINEHQTTVLIVSHSTDQIERMCNKAVWIEKGHMRMIGPAKEVCDTYRMIGGRTGSAEAEAKVVELTEANIPLRAGCIETITSTNRYETACEFARRSGAQEGATIILAPTEQASYCLASSYFAAATNSHVLLTEWNQLPPATQKYLEEIKPSRILIAGSEAQVSEAVVELIRQTCPQANIERIEGRDPYLFSEQAYEFAKDSWGDTALITWSGCTGDMISLMPFACLANAPLFFNIEAHAISQATMDILLKFKRVLVLGGTQDFSEACIKPLRDAGIQIDRFCGVDAYDANGIICRWMKDNDARFAIGERLDYIVASYWNPYDALCAGPYVKQHRTMFLIEDIQNMDSVARAIEYLEECKDDVEKLVFLGDSNYTAKDKMLLGKAISQ